MKTKEEIIESADKELEFLKFKYHLVSKKTCRKEVADWIENLKIVDCLWYDLRDRALILNSGVDYTFSVHPITIGRFTSSLYKGSITGYHEDERWEFYTNAERLYYYDQNRNQNYYSDYYQHVELHILHLFLFDLIQIVAEVSHEIRILKYEMERK